MKSGCEFGRINLLKEKRKQQHMYLQLAHQNCDNQIEFVRLVQQLGDGYFSFFSFFFLSLILRPHFSSSCWYFERKSYFSLLVVVYFLIFIHFMCTTLCILIIVVAHARTHTYRIDSNRISCKMNRLV